MYNNPEKKVSIGKKNAGFFKTCLVQFSDVNGQNPS
jgi:hypothetical protein